MSALFDHLSAAFEEGHSREVSDLISEGHYANTDRMTPAAVLIAVTDRPEPGVILTQRPRGMRNHPGQVAFPGGKVDAGEDAITAALREAEEELALPRQAVKVIGTGDLYQTGTGFEITPVLGVVPPDLELTPSPTEVEAWFEAPLALLLDESSWTEHEAFWRGAMRQYFGLDYEGFHIWGVTAGIIFNLAKRMPLETLNAHFRSA